MTTPMLLAHAARAAAVLAAALLARRLLARAPAATRRLALVAALAAVVAMPLVSTFAPRWRVAPPAPWSGPAAAIDVRPPVAEPLAEGGGAPETRAVAAPRERQWPWDAIVLAVWAAGALVVFGRTLSGLARARRLARSGAPLEHEAARSVLAEAGAPRVALRESDAVDGPLVTGILRPTILVPPGARAWSRDRWRFVLLHELAHVRRHDCLAQLVARLACALHWFDPLVWMAARALRHDREVAADDAVVLAGARPSSYAAHLVALAQAAHGERAEVLAMTASPLEARVRALLDARNRARALGRAGALATLGAASCAALAVACVGSRGGNAPVAPPTAVAGPAPRPSATDAKLQRIVDEEVESMRRAWDASTVVAVAIDPSTGDVLAATGVANDARVTGSTLKPFTVASALDAGAVHAGDRFFCENGARTYPAGGTLHDAGSYGWLDVGEILAVSSNVCTAKIAEALGGERLVAQLRRFHLGDAPSSIPSIDLGTMQGAASSVGEGPAITPRQLAAAYAVLANGGVYRAGHASPGERVIGEATARDVLAMLEGAVSGARATGKAARVDGVRVAGKTGTADVGSGRMYASFVGIAPADAPRIVLLVGAESAKEDAVGGKVAAPVFARIVSRWLAP